MWITRVVAASTEHVPSTWGFEKAWAAEKEAEESSDAPGRARPEAAVAAGPELTMTLETQAGRLLMSLLMEMTCTLLLSEEEEEEEEEEGGPEMEAARASALPAGIPSTATESCSLHCKRRERTEFKIAFFFTLKNNVSNILFFPSYIGRRKPFWHSNEKKNKNKNGDSCFFFFFWASHEENISANGILVLSSHPCQISV